MKNRERAPLGLDLQDDRLAILGFLPVEKLGLERARVDAIEHQVVEQISAALPGGRTQLLVVPGDVDSLEVARHEC